MKLVNDFHFSSFWGNKAIVALYAFFALTACSNSVGDDVASVNLSDDSAVATLEPAVGPQIEFTGNPVYDIGQLNDYWKGLGKSLDERNEIMGGAHPKALSKNSGGSTEEFRHPIQDVSWGKDVFKWLTDFFGDKIKSPGLKSLFQIGMDELAGALGFNGDGGAKVMGTINDILDEVEAMRKQLDEMQDYLEKHITTVVMSAEELTLAKERILERNRAYDEHQTHLENDLYAALQSLYLSSLEASGVAKFKTFDEWNALSEEERGKYLADEKYKAYMEKNNEALAKKAEEIILKWGDATVVGSPAANAAFNVIKMLSGEITISNRTAIKNYAGLYELLAYETVVWEAEGYEWRQQMINADIAFLAELSMAASWYYAINQNNQAVANLEKYMEKFQKYVDNNKIVRHSTPIYVKSGSKSRNQIFTGKINQINYADVLKTKWHTKATKTIAHGVNKKYPLEEDTYKYNASRLFGGFAPYKINDDYKMNVYSKTAKMVMPESFYKELYDSYAVQTPNGVKRKTLVQIFKDAGFTMASGEEIPMKPYKKEKTENFFLTGLRPYTHSVKEPSLCARCYQLGVSVAIANTDGDIFGTKDHESLVAAYEARYVYTPSHYGKKTHEHDASDSFRIFMNLKKDYSSYRNWLYPVKTDKSIEIKEE